MNQCSCNNKFFIEHKKAIVFSHKTQYFHVFHDHPSLDLKYSILECINCGKLYICSKTLDGKIIERFIDVNEFNEENAEAFLARAKLLTNYLQYTDQFVSNMIRKVE